MAKYNFKKKKLKDEKFINMKKCQKYKENMKNDSKYVRFKMTSKTEELQKKHLYNVISGKIQL